MQAEELFVSLLGEEGPPPAGVAADYLALAAAVIAGYLGRDSLPEHRHIAHAQALMALALYNRRGAEGEAHRAEGNLRSTFEAMPLLVKLQLRPFRTARALGNGGEAQG